MLHDKMQIFLLSRRLLINLQSQRDITISDEGKKESRSHIQYFLSERDTKLHPSATYTFLKRGWRDYCLLVKHKESVMWNIGFCQEISIEMFTGRQRKRAALDMNWNSRWGKEIYLLGMKCGPSRSVGSYLKGLHVREPSR